MMRRDDDRMPLGFSVLCWLGFAAIGWLITWSVGLCVYRIVGSWLSSR